MLNLGNKLRSYGIETRVISEWPDDSIDINEYSAFILDKRDSSFPQEIIQKKIKRIALDNRGAGRSQAHLRIDTLPHYDMNMYEFKQTLKHVMLPCVLEQKASRVFISRLKFLSPLKLPATRHTRADHREWGRLSLDLQAKHLKKLENMECVIVYFGQTLFEAIYLGKKIFLYDISPHHGRLSKYFLVRWNSLLSRVLYFDGKGLERVSEKIGFFLKSI